MALPRTVGGCSCTYDRGRVPLILRKEGIAMVTFEALLALIAVLCTIAGGAFALGFHIGKLSGKRK